jgi:chromate transporter
MAGAAASFIGFGLPAFLFMMSLSALYECAHTLPKVISAFSGLQAIIVAIVANATLSFGRASVKNWKSLIIAAIVAIMFGLRVNPILVIVLAAFLGFLFFSRQPLPDPISASARKSSSLRFLFISLLSAAALGFGLIYLLNRRLFDLAALSRTNAPTMQVPRDVDLTEVVPPVVCLPLPGVSPASPGPRFPSSNFSP